MPSGPYTKWEFSVDSNKFHPKQNSRIFFELMVTSFFREYIPDCSIQTQFTHGKQKQFDAFFVDGFCSHCSTVFEAMGCYYHFHSCREGSLLQHELEDAIKRREKTEHRRQYLEKLNLFREVEGSLKYGSVNGRSRRKQISMK